jgi:hypothetical protein
MKASSVSNRDSRTGAKMSFPSLVIETPSSFPSRNSLCSEMIQREGSVAFTTVVHPRSQTLQVNKTGFFMVMS